MLPSACGSAYTAACVNAATPRLPLRKLPALCRKGYARRHVGRSRAVKQREEPITQTSTSQPSSSGPSEAAASIALLGVALLWASYTPVMRLFFDIPGAPDPVIVSVIKSLIATVALVAFIPVEQTLSNDTADDEATSHQAPQAPANLAVNDVKAATGGFLGSLRVLMNRGTDSLFLASSEIGAYSAIGSISQAWGVSHISAMQAGFLVQFTAVMTPVIAFLAGERVSRRTWKATAFALVGTLMITADGFLQATKGATSGVSTLPAEQVAASAAIVAAASSVPDTAAQLAAPIGDAAALSDTVTSFASPTYDGAVRMLDTTMQVAQTMVSFSDANSGDFMAQLGDVTVPLTFDGPAVSSAGGMAAEFTQNAAAQAADAASAVSTSGLVDSAAQAQADADLLMMLLGDGAVLLSALCYSIVTFRLSVLTTGFSSVELSAGRYAAMTFFAAIAGILFVILPMQSSGGVSLEALWPSYGNLFGWLLVAYAAVGPGAAASALQMFGQASVSSARTQVLLSTIPLWGALIAYGVLHEDLFGQIGWVGAALIVWAGVSAK